MSKPISPRLKLIAWLCLSSIRTFWLHELINDVCIINGFLICLHKVHCRWGALNLAGSPLKDISWPCLMVKSPVLVDTNHKSRRFQHTSLFRLPIFPTLSAFSFFLSFFGALFFRFGSICTARAFLADCGIFSVS